MSTAEHDPSQAWFWTAEWQAKEQEADDDIREGRYDDYDTADDFISHLIPSVTDSVSSYLTP